MKQWKTPNENSKSDNQPNQLKETKATLTTTTTTTKHSANKSITRFNKKNTTNLANNKKMNYLLCKEEEKRVGNKHNKKVHKINTWFLCIDTTSINNPKKKK